MDDDLVLLTVSDVRVAVPAGNGVEAGLVLLQESGYPGRILRMYVGQPEARAIHVSWSNTVPPRPSTWDLFVSTVALLDARIERVIISDVQEERHYFAQMVVHRADSDEPVLVTARPSDALALALRAYGAKIYARPHVLDDAGVLADGTRWVRPEPVAPAEEEAVDEADIPLGTASSHGMLSSYPVTLPDPEAPRTEDDGGGAVAVGGRPARSRRASAPAKAAKKAAPAKAAKKAAPAKATKAAKAAPTKATPAKATAAKAIPAKATPAKATPAKATATKAIPAKAAPAKATRTAPATTAPATTAPGRAVKATKAAPAARAPRSTRSAGAGQAPAPPPPDRPVVPDDATNPAPPAAPTDGTDTASS